jgi:hypothetical protein
LPSRQSVRLRVCMSVLSLCISVALRTRVNASGAVIALLHSCLCPRSMPPLLLLVLYTTLKCQFESGFFLRKSPDALSYKIAAAYTKSKGSSPSSSSSSSSSLIVDRRRPTSIIIALHGSSPVVIHRSVVDCQKGLWALRQKLRHLVSRPGSRIAANTRA